MLSMFLDSSISVRDKNLKYLQENEERSRKATEEKQESEKTIFKWKKHKIIDCSKLCHFIEEDTTFFFALI
jgi:hypothetical protein